MGPSRQLFHAGSVRPRGLHGCSKNKLLTETASEAPLAPFLPVLLRLLATNAMNARLTPPGGSFPSLRFVRVPRGPEPSQTGGIKFKVDKSASPKDEGKLPKRKSQEGND